MSAYRSQLALRAGLTLVTALVLGTVPVVAQTEEREAGSATTVVPPGEEPLGIAYADWGAEWWQWLLNVPPVEDPELGDCQAGQGGEVFFIPHVPPDVSVTEECSVGADQWILASAGGTVWDNSDGCCGPEELLGLVEADIPIFSEPAISIDGEEVPDIESYWVTNPLFLIDYAEDNPLGFPAGTWRAAMGGWFVMIPPLEPGDHTIVVRDAIDIPDDEEGPLTAELTARVTVGAEEEPLPDGSPSAAPMDSTPAPSPVSPAPLGPETGPLEPGTYADDSIGVEVRFTVDEGWEVSGEPIEEVGTQLGFPGIEGLAAMTITRYSGEAFAEPCVTGADPEAYFANTVTTDTTAEDFIEQLSANPFLMVEEPTEVEIAGVPGRQVDLTASIPADECPDQVTFLWPLPQVQEFHLADGESARVIALDAGTGFVPVIFIEAFPGVDWPAFLEEAMSVVESMEIGTPSG